jgi:hypothetical protein
MSPDRKVLEEGIGLLSPVEQVIPRCVAPPGIVETGIGVEQEVRSDNHIPEEGEYDQRKSGENESGSHAC